MKKPLECYHELLQRVDKMDKAPPRANGVMRPFMVCAECGAVLYLAMTPNGEPEVFRPWVNFEPRS